jgi:hypothetical protein
MGETIMGSKSGRRSFVVAVACAVFFVGFVAAEEPVDNSLPGVTGIPAPELAPWPGLQGENPGGGGVIDDFNRPDGPLGSDWTILSPAFSIVNQQATGTTLALATHNTATGDRVEIDAIVSPVPTTQYAAVVLNYGGGSSNIFIKVQKNGSGALFDYAACYLGDGQGGQTFGLGFFQLSSPFSSARMAVEVDGARTVTIDFIDIDGGAQPDQQYICTGAPAPEGPGIGIGTYGENLVRIDNFGDGPIPVELMSIAVD